MAIEMGKDLRVGHDARNAIAMLIDQHRGHAHDVAAIAQLGVNTLNGVAGRAGEAVAVEGAVDSCLLVECAANTPIGLWQLSQWRVYSIPLVRGKMLTLAR